MILKKGTKKIKEEKNKALCLILRMSSNLIARELHTDLLGKNICKRVKKIGLDRGRICQECNCNQGLRQPYGELWSWDGPSELSQVEEIGLDFCIPTSDTHWLPPAPWAVVGVKYNFEWGSSLWLREVSSKRQVWGQKLILPEAGGIMYWPSTGALSEYYSIHYSKSFCFY